MTPREWCEVNGYLDNDEPFFIRLRRILRSPETSEDERQRAQAFMANACRWIAPERQEQLLASPWLLEVVA